MNLFALSHPCGGNLARMPARRRIPLEQGRKAVAGLADLPQPSQSAEPEVATAVRYLLEELATRHPGRLVEVRVPPWGAVQCAPPHVGRSAAAGGLSVHTRGTPPHVVECQPWAWIALATGRAAWQEMVEAGLVQASGHQADLSAIFPLIEP